MNRASVRVRITALAVAVVAVVAIGGSIVLVVLQRLAFDESLEEATVDGTATVRSEVFEDADEATATLQATQAIGVPVGVLILGVGVWILVGRTLRPVEAIRADVATLGDGDWHRRVPEPGTDDEIDRLARTMNQMLERLETASARQRRFVGDASHELRTPLTRLRAQIEVARDDPAIDADDVLRQTLTEVEELSDLVDDLLALARLDDGRPLVREEVDLDVLVTQLLRPYRDDPSVTIDGSGIAAARVRGDERLLRRAVDNLVRNAVRHATSTVRVTTGEQDDHAIVRVADDGPGIAVPDRERVFERFTRLDDARSRDEGGTGLGLAICRDVVRAHGGTVGIDDGPDGGATFAIRLPRGT